MFAKLKSMLSVHVAPGAANFSIRPFAFVFGGTYHVAGSAHREHALMEQVRNELELLADVLDEDDLQRGRDMLDSIRQTIAGVIGDA